MNTRQFESQATTLAYSGELEVQGGDFILNADLLIIRAGEASFVLTGSDEYGELKTEGKSILTSKGTYVANQHKVNYVGFVSDDYATIQFDAIRPTVKKLRCFVEGKWTQGGETWTFSGNLRQYKKPNNTI
ncbi:MAG: hypothetical protein PXX77_10165 [Gallionella sp.]|nr:hypothetical protein [Gallionella sp.]